MYVRSTPGKPRRDGSQVSYVQLAHNVWDPDKKRSRVQVIHTFGRADRLDVEGMRRLVGSLQRYLDGSADTGEPVTGDTGTTAGLRLLSSRPMGAAWLLDGLWRQLGLGEAIASCLPGRRLDARVERVLFALVASRAINPCSKLAALEWAAHDVHLPGVSDLGGDPQVLYRAMDFLRDNDTQIQEQVFFAIAGRLGLACDVIMFDTTSTYFETEDDDDFRRYGASKDHRPDRPQAIIGLAVTKEGIPVRVWSWPGNSADQTVIKTVHADLAGWGLHRVLWVGDRGFTSAENRTLLQTGGGHVLFGEKLRGVSANDQALARPGRYSQVADNLHVKEVWVGEGVTRRRFIVVRNPGEAIRDAATRERHLTRIATELAAIETKSGDARLAAEGELLAHPVLKRYLTRRKGTLVVNTAAARAEERLDGKFLLSCTDDNLSAADAARLFKGLLDVERGFRDLKQVLEVRPVFHRKTDQIRAHITLCFLALVLIRVAENATGDTWPTLSRDLERIHLIDLHGSTGRVTQRTDITDDQAAIYTACKIPAPPLILTAEPAPKPRRRRPRTQS